MREIPETDLVKLAEREVIEKAREWHAIWRDTPVLGNATQAAYEHKMTEAECDLLAAVTLLESRKALTTVDPTERAKGDSLLASIEA